jgi:hypothetical protein
VASICRSHYPRPNPFARKDIPRSSAVAISIAGGWRWHERRSGTVKRGSTDHVVLHGDTIGATHSGSTTRSFDELAFCVYGGYALCASEGT